MRQLLEGIERALPNLKVLEFFGKYVYLDDVTTIAVNQESFSRLQDLPHQLEELVITSFSCPATPVLDLLESSSSLTKNDLLTNMLIGHLLISLDWRIYFRKSKHP